MANERVQPKAAGRALTGDPVPVPRGEASSSRSMMLNPPDPNKPRRVLNHEVIQVKGNLKSTPTKVPPKQHRRWSRQRICCYLFAALVLLVFALAVAAGVLYFSFRPKSPSYSINSISIRGLNLSSPTFNSGFLSPKLRVSVLAVNPNKWLGFSFREAGSSVNIYYYKRHLSWGKWPSFYHGTRNETVVHLSLKGKEVRLTASEEYWMRDAEKNRRVPLKLLAEMPVRVKFGKLKLWKMTTKLHCDFMVNKVSPVSKVVSRNCTQKLHAM